MTNLYKHIAEVIRSLRNTYGGNGLSQAALADKVGTTANTISRWEAAEYKPSAKDLDKLARFFNQPISIFFPKMGQDNQESAAKQALLSALGDLNEKELLEVTRYAQFRKAYEELSQAKPKKRSRK